MTTKITIGILAVSTVVLAVMLSNKNKEITRLNGIMLPLAKKPDSGIKLSDLTPGTQVDI